MIRRLPAAPLLELIEARGGPSAVGARKRTAMARAYYRARAEGSLTTFAADRMATSLLGVHPLQIWGEDWWQQSA